MSGFRRANETFENAAESIRYLGRQQAQQAELLNRTVAQLERFAEKEKQIIEALDRTELLRHEMAQAREETRKVEASLKSGIADGFQAVSRRIDTESSATLAMLLKVTSQQEEAIQRADALGEGLNDVSANLSGAIGALKRDHAEALRVAEERNERIRTLLAEIESVARASANSASAAETAASARLQEIAALLGRTSEVSAGVQALIEYAVRQPESLASAMRPALAEGLGSLTRAVEETTATFRDGLVALAEQQNSLAATLDATGPARALAHELRQVATSIEAGMATGFTDLARAVEGIFLSYAELARRAEGPASEPAKVAAAAATAVAGAPNHAEVIAAKESEMRDRLRDIARDRHPVPRKHA
jgi:DNA repair exonuclease SbcCD ATPase subunit